ncbi:autotransporter strand-loop-strand O-heptosyltransferase [Novispirillum sp. DQ9]|uniref:autotransporter strand-loop-strand O-heptosyltransferase n=1 Tax=Novispirillum sp. DQ9 TaxID=3398612 RepID=UPI003C7BED2E
MMFVDREATSAAPDSVAPTTSPFTAPPSIPTQQGPLGIRFDFNDGIRVSLPASQTPWLVRLSDLDTGNILFEAKLCEGVVTSSKRYYIRGRVEVWRNGEIVLDHRYSPRDRPVLVEFAVGTLGDTLGWMPYAARFGRERGCQLTCSISPWMVPVFQSSYPDITFLSPDQVAAEGFYASYRLGLYFDDADGVLQPCDFRLVGLHRTAAYILGVDPREEPPRVAVEEGGPPFPEPYVCIAVQSSTQCKYWNNPGGWRDVVSHLSGLGYRVVCIDQRPMHGQGIVWNHLPHGVEDQTGDRPLAERARWIRHADVFIGLSSGLSWLAWAVGTPVVMISGFTHPTNEFETPYRVINYHACNSCWNDPLVRFDHHDFLWCPRHKGTARQFECTGLITAQQVIATLHRVPAVRTMALPPAETPR